MSLLLRTPLPPDPVLATWVRARHAHDARRWWALWNRGAPVAELIATGEEDGALTMRFAQDDPPQLHADVRGAALLHFVLDRVDAGRARGPVRVAWADGELVMVPAGDGAAPDDDPAVLAATARAVGLAFTGAATLESILAAHPAVLPTACGPALAQPGWRLGCDEETSRDHRWFIERTGARWWIEPDAGRVRLMEADRRSTGAPAGHPIALRHPRECSPGLADRWRRWLDAQAGVRSRTAAVRSSFVLHAELLEHYRYVYRAARVKDHPKLVPSGHHVYRIDRRAQHPAWGRLDRPDAIELVQILLEESLVEPEVVVEDDATPWRTAREGAFTLVGVWDDDPTLLLLRAPLGVEPPQSGWLKPVDVGTSTLAKRKLAFMGAAIDRRGTARLIESPEQSWRSPELAGWPLATRGPLHLVQGPPGTGKTWTATQAARWILGREPFARILVCAREHLALNHLAMELVKALASEPVRVEPCLVRVLRERKVEDLLVGESAGLRTAVADVAGKAVWSSRRPAGTEALWSLLEQRRKGLDAPWVAEAARREASIVCSTTTDPWLVDLLDDPDGGAFDWLVVEEAGKCYLSDLVAPMAAARQWLLIGDHKQLPPYQLRQVQAHLARIRDVRDEDLATEPDAADLRAARRLAPDIARDAQLAGWLQPFRLLFETAEQAGRAVVLRGQRRLQRSLSDLVGRTFYGAPFDHQKPERTWPRPSSSWLDGRHELLWIDTPPAMEDRRFGEEPAEGRSLRNRGEAEVIAGLVRSIFRDLDSISLAVLTPYQGQKDLLCAELARLGKLRDGRSAARVVHTTDEFQGKEADIVLLSLVRNNDRPTVRGRWGFVLDPARLNVMFSRARQVMAVVGCREHVARTTFATPGDGGQPGTDDVLPALVDGFRACARCVSFRELGVMR
jgi:AAA domain